jgi:transcription antitermination factor NusG
MEFEAREALKDLVEIFCPIETHWVKIRGGKKNAPPKYKQSERPLIPGYMFIGLNMTAMRQMFERIRYAKGVSGVLMCDGIPVVIPAGVIRDLQDREKDGEFVLPPSEAAKKALELLELPNRSGEATPVAEGPSPLASAKAMAVEAAQGAVSQRRVAERVSPGVGTIDARVVEGVKAKVNYGTFKNRIFTVLSIQGAMAVLDAEMFGKAIPLPIPLDQLEYFNSGVKSTCQAPQSLVMHEGSHHSGSA